MNVKGVAVLYNLGYTYYVDTCLEGLRNESVVRRARF